ncbi:eukaryotic translation initiation factor 3 subunit D [Wilcoxina mikolae CBS 423.85]|nr:eukaryotic translation initiation factor 3 subunit D [Wilcoxina mikolae CBS 423.85]
MAPSFQLSALIASLPESEDGAWGPPASTDSSLNEVPYAPYSKADKLGRMADWTQDSGKDGRDNRGGRQGYNRNYRDQQVYGAGTSSLFSYQHAEDEASFSVVDNTRTSTKPRMGFGRGGGTIFRGRGSRGGTQSGRGGATSGRGGFQRTQTGRGGHDSRFDSRGGRGGRGGRRFGWKDWDKPQRNRDASVIIKPEWKMLEEIDFNRLAKLNLETDEGEDIESYGFLHYYDRSNDKAAGAKTAERRLAVQDRLFFNPTASDDPVIQDLAQKDEATIFATDSVLSMLMCAPRSVYPWDIVIVREGNKIFLDKREGSQIDYVSVNENATDPPLDVSEGNKDAMNAPQALSMEATFINQNFAIQTVNETASKYEFPQPNPFYNSEEDSEPLGSKAYKYRRFDLSLNEEEPMHLIVRTEVDAVVKAGSGEEQFLTIKALNEFDDRAQGSGGALNWRQKLGSQLGAVVATEMKNNSCKLARWTTQSILAKAHQMKLGFVSRATPKDNNRHVILGVVSFKPREFASQMNLNLNNGWGIVRTIVDMCMQMPEGKYVLVKDPNKPVLRLYEVPVNTFEDEEEDVQVQGSKE